MDEKYCEACFLGFIPKAWNQKYCSKICYNQWTENQRHGWFEESSRNRYVLYERDSFKCIYCGKTTADYDIVLTLDHIIPVSSDPEGFFDLNAAGNLVTSCKSCNCSKSNNFLSEESKRFVLTEVKRRNEEHGISDQMKIRFSR